MLRIFAETKPDADVAYLSAAIIRDALFAKFRELFGRDPVAVDQQEPLVVKDAKVPEIILGGVDHDIIPILRASAVEHSKANAGEMPEIPNAILLYIINEDTPAKISLEAVKEYQEMDSAARDAVVSAAAETEAMNVEDGVAYVSKDLSTLEIGVYAGTQEFAQEFQYRLENAGGTQLDEQSKLKVFDQLLADLPGGDAVKESDARTNLLRAVGLTSALPAGEQTPDNLKAPGPQGQAAEPK